MIGPPPLEPIQICAWIEPLPAVTVTVAPFVKVGHVPMTFGRFGGMVPFGDETVVPEPLSSPFVVDVPEDVPEPLPPLEL